MAGYEKLGLWVTIVAMALGIVATYIRFETRVENFITHADAWHMDVKAEIRDFRREEIPKLDQKITDQRLIHIKELAEELDEVQIQLTQLQERQKAILEMMDDER